jgi:fatty-acyl-CoA synthase
LSCKTIREIGRLGWHFVKVRDSLSPKVRFSGDSVATPTVQLDRAATRERVLEVVRGLLSELGSQGALSMLGLDAHLDNDLGLGSLERVELMARLETEFGVRLPDRIAAEANTPAELADAILASPISSEEQADESSGLRASVTVQELHREAPDRGVLAAQTLNDVLRYRALHNSGQIHLHITEEAEGGERNLTMTFGELYAAALRCAAELARLGVPAGGRVSLMLPTSRAFFVSYAGILLAGAIPVPIYPPFRADRIEEYAARQAAILNNAGVCLLLTFRRAEAVAKLLKPRVRSLEAVLDADNVLDAADKAPAAAPGALPTHLTGSRIRKASDIALLQYTSGSTGNPKGVVLTHANLLANIRSIGEAVQIGPQDAAVSWLPLYHDMGLIGAWLTILHYGIPLVALPPLAFLTRPERWLWAFHKHRGTLAAAPNFAYELCVRKIADKEIENLDLSSWRAALNGAEPVNPETLERFEQRFSQYGFRREAQLPVYGLAEASLAVTVPPLDRGPWVDSVVRKTFTASGRAIPAPAGEAAISFVSCGKPIPGHEVRIVDEKGNEAPERTEGFLWFRGPSATNGYYNNPEATQEIFENCPPSDGGFAWVNSGDRAYFADGELFVTGRVKDIIIKGGRNIYPHEVEELASRVEGIRKGCVVAFGLQDEGAGTEKLVVVAETREENSPRRAAIAARVTERVTQGLGLPPDRVELIPSGSIPKTSSGKLRREETRQLYIAGTLAAKRPPVWMQVARLGTASAARTTSKTLLNAFRRGLESLYGIYFYLLFVVWILPTWSAVLFFKDHRAAGRFTSAALKVLFGLGGIRVGVIGREYLDSPGPKIYVSNHASYFDALALMRGLGVSYRFVAKMEVRGMPFIGTFLHKMGHLSFDRTDSKARRQAAQEIEDVLRAGESVFVFPEGTFVPEAGVRPFQLGAFKAAVATGAPIIPVSLAGTRRFLRDGTYLPRPTRVIITLSAPVYPNSSLLTERASQTSNWHELVRLRDAARETIARHAGEPLL